MNGQENLIPVRSTEEARERGRNGGIKSGISRKNKKTIEQMAKIMLEGKITETAKISIKRSGIDLSQFEDDDINGMAYMMAGQVKAAAQGNTNALEAVVKYAQKAERQEEEKNHYTIPITDITKDFVDVYRAVHESFDTGKYREIISKGGRGSIKSNFWAALAEETIYNDPMSHVVYTRRYKTDLRGSVYNQFVKTITRHGKLDEWDFTTSPMKATYIKTGQTVWFLGADKPISAKSATLQFGYVKLLIHEECDEMAGIEQMDNIEDTFLRSDIFALDIKVYNPPKSASNFMNAYTVSKIGDPSTFICHSYYYNVPVSWLGQRFFDRANWFLVNKPKYYANNYDGEVTGTGGNIFENVESRQITDSEIDSFGDVINGLDFGFNHPQTFIRAHYDADNDVLYPFYEVWSRKCKNSTFARKIKAFKTVEIIADSARPDSIAEMQDWGFDVIGAKKRWASNKGRDYCWEWLQQTTKIVIDPERTPHLYDEMTKLEFEQLKDGSFSSQYPTLGEDCIMALIYGLNRVIMDSRREDCYDDDIEDEEEMLEDEGL